MNGATPAGVVVAGALLLLALAPGRAAAGGALWGFEGHPIHGEAIFVPGDDVRARGAVGLQEISPKQPGDAFSAGPEHGPFYGYISARTGPSWGPYAPPLPEDAMLVGEVRFTESKHPQVLDLSLDFVMPDLEPGYYTLHHCNDPCTRQIGSMMSTPITLVEDRGQALLAARLYRLERRDQALRPRLDNQIDKLSSENAGLESDITALQNKIDKLEDEPVATPPSPEPSMWTAVGWGIAGAVLALLIVVAFGNLRPRLKGEAVPHLR